jgi:hypothetical protein
MTELTHPRPDKKKLAENYWTSFFVHHFPRHGLAPADDLFHQDNNKIKNTPNTGVFFILT